MNNNVDLANFDKMLELAEFGAKRHNERRQNLFKAIISYITLLVLALYYTLNNENMLTSSLFIGIAIVLLFIIHGIFLEWLWKTSVASINDVRRRDFYLKKAEVLSYHLSQSRFSSFAPNPCKYIKLNMASGKSWKITERCLFEMREPNLIIGKAPRKKPPDSKRRDDIHFLALAVLPSVLVSLLIVKLVLIIGFSNISEKLAQFFMLISDLWG